MVKQYFFYTVEDRREKLDFGQIRGVPEVISWPFPECRSPWEMCFELKSIGCQITGESLEIEHIVH